MKIKSLTLKLILFVSSASALVFLSVLAVNYHFTERLLIAEIRANTENLAQRTVNRIESVLAAVKKIPENTAGFLEYGDFDKERMTQLLKMVVANNAEVYGSGIAFEPYAFDKNEKYFSPYWAREERGLVFYQLGAADYDYFTMDWYQLARELGRPVWTEPYYDDVLMASYCVPFFQRTASGRQLKGVVTADISLQWLSDIVSSVRVLKTGDAYLISRLGTIITHPQKELIMNETIFSVAESRDDGQLRRIGRSMVKGETGFVLFVSIARNKKCWMYYAPVPSTGWTLAVVLPQDELFADLRRNALITGVLALCGIVMLVLVISWLSHSATKHLRLMSRAARSIGGGDFDSALPVVRSEDEVGALSRTLSSMQSALKDYIRKLTDATAAKERIESELKIAHDIQTGILPRIFPPFPSRKEFDIFALMEPAKEVGGDFYDFFLIDDYRLFFVMGDVSGKGVPAALFMMITKTLLKNEALRGLPADQILTTVNSILAMDNTATMFATVFCGILDTRSGEVEFSNAGHNPPLVSLEGKPFEFLSVSKGFVLGPMPGFTFTAKRLRMSKGDVLFLYTDGITEAMNPGKEFFSEERLRSLLIGMQGRDITELVHVLRQEVKAFARTEPQSDDITMLILRFN